MKLLTSLYIRHIVQCCTQQKAKDRWHYSQHQQEAHCIRLEQSHIDAGVYAATKAQEGFQYTHCKTTVVWKVSDIGHQG